MYDELFPEQTGNALSVRVPLRPPARGLFSGFGSALAAIPRVAVAETARALEGFQQTIMPSLMSVVDEPRARIREAGIDMPTFSESIGQDIKRSSPDPETTGEASRVVFGVGKVLAKAIPLGLVGGVPLAALGTGLIEGTSEAQRLGDEGVDPATAAKVGAVRAVSTAAGIALPVAGRTLAQTAALVLAGGPLSFMAEQQLSSMILDAADYGKIASQYDPLDPVGLAIATLIPGAVGGVVHGARAKRARAEAEPKPAEDFTPTPDQEAAARVVQTSAHAQEAALHRPGDVAGAAAHMDALELARRQLDAGEPVSVGAVLRQVEREEAARLRAAETPGFLRTADDLIALRMKERPFLTPELARAIEIAKTPGFMRSAEDRIFMRGMLDDEPAAPREPAAKVEPQPAVEPAPAARADAAQEPAAQPGEAAKPADPLEQSAREIARAAPDMKVLDEFTGQEAPAGKLLDDTEAIYRQDLKDAEAFPAAVACFMRH